MNNIKVEHFSDIIGYSELKSELEIVIDILNNKEKYEKFGAKTPSGILLYGRPGTGKTRMAEDFLKSVNRKSYIIRKTKSDGNFVDEIRETFNTAIENAPSIILMDDLDKFSNDDEDRRDSEEFVCIQSMIDEAYGKDVFFFATVNNLRKIPHSLCRAKRFEKMLEVPIPKLADATKIVDYYISQKQFVEKLDSSLIAKLLLGSSCAELESTINKAALRAAYNDKEKVTMEDMIEAILDNMYGNLRSEDNKTPLFEKVAAYHEASHAVVSEILEPGSVDLVSIVNYGGDVGGITSSTRNDDYFNDIRFMQNRVTVLLAGKAGTEVMLGMQDVGANNDIHRAYDIVERFVDNYCSLGFSSFETQYSSDSIKDLKSNSVNIEMAIYYQNAKDIIFKNKDLVDKIANELIKNGYLLNSDIKEVFDELKSSTIL